MDDSGVQLEQWFLTWGLRSPEWSWTIFGGVASRNLAYTAVLHFFIRVL